VAAPAAVPPMAPAPIESAPVIAAEPGPAPLQRAPEPPVLEELQPVTVQKTRRPVVAPVVLPEPGPTAAREAPTAAPEKLPPIDPFR
jgi:fused signal recognition particle receptor